MTMATSPSAPAARSGERACDPAVLNPSDTFVRRHLGPCEAEIREMLAVVGFPTLDAFSDAVVPASIRLPSPPALNGLPARERGEHEVLAGLAAIAAQNTVAASYIGMGYYGTITPPVILRNILENPGTRSTPPTRPKSPRAVWKPCSTSRPSSAT
jgi:glycine dehydrogenase